MSDMDATPSKLTVEGYLSGAWTDITDYTGPERAVDISTAEPPSKPARMTLPLWKQSGGLLIPDWMPIRVSDQSNPSDPYPRYFYGFVPSNEQGIANNINETYALNAIGFDTLWDHPPAQITVKRTYGYLEWLPDHLYAVGDIVRRPGSLDVYIVESIMGDGMSGDTEPFGQTPSPYYIDNNVSWDVAPVSPYVSDLDVLNDLLPEYFDTEVTYTHMNQLCADIGYFEILPGMSPKESMQALATRVADMLGATYPTWVALSPYVRGDRREPITANGYGYLCIKDGVSSNNPNIFVGHTTIGGEFDDGSTRWVCFGQTSVAPTWQFNTPNDNGAHTAPWIQDVAWFDANNSTHAPLLSIEYSDAYVEDSTHKHYNDIVIHRDGNGYANHVDVTGRNGAYGYAEDANAILNAQRVISMSYIDNSEDGPETQEDCEILANQILGKVLTRETVTLSSKTPLSVVVMQGGLRFGAITTALLGLSSQVYPMTRVSMKMGLDGSTWDYEFGAPFRTDLEDVLSGTLRGVRRFPGDHTAPDLVSFADVWFPFTTWVLSNTADPLTGLVTLVLAWHSGGEADLSHFIPRLRLASESYDRWLPRVDYPRTTITIADLPQNTDFYIKVLAVDTSGNPHPPINEASWATSPTETTATVVGPSAPTGLQIDTSLYVNGFLHISDYQAIAALKWTPVTILPSYGWYDLRYWRTSDPTQITTVRVSYNLTGINIGPLIVGEQYDAEIQPMLPHYPGGIAGMTAFTVPAYVGTAPVIGTVSSGVSNGDYFIRVPLTHAGDHSGGGWIIVSRTGGFDVMHAIPSNAAWPYTGIVKHLAPNILYTIEVYVFDAQGRRSPTATTTYTILLKPNRPPPPIWDDYHPDDSDLRGLEVHTGLSTDVAWLTTPLYDGLTTLSLGRSTGTVVHTMLGPKIPISAAEWVTVGAARRRSGLSGSSTSGLFVRFYDASDALIGSPSTIFSGVATTSFVFSEGKVQAPANTVYMRWALVHDNSGGSSSTRSYFSYPRVVKAITPAQINFSTDSTHAIELKDSSGVNRRLQYYSPAADRMVDTADPSSPATGVEVRDAIGTQMQQNGLWSYSEDMEVVGDLTVSKIIFGDATEQTTSSGGKYAGDVGDGTSTSIVVTHSLGTRDVFVEVYDNTSPYAQAFPTVQHTGTSTITLKFTIAPTTNQYRVVVRS